MKVTVKLLKPFSDIAGKDEISLDFEGELVSQALENLCQLHPKLKNELYDAKGEISYSVNIFLNDRPLGAAEEEKTTLSDGDKILIFMPVSGG
jgi:MoaD family protein